MAHAQTKDDEIELTSTRKEQVFVRMDPEEINRLDTLVHQDPDLTRSYHLRRAAREYFDRNGV
jgi:hypothetical protein